LIDHDSRIANANEPRTTGTAPKLMDGASDVPTFSGGEFTVELFGACVPFFADVEVPIT